MAQILKSSSQLQQQTQHKSVDTLNRYKRPGKKLGVNNAARKVGL
jgi:hypothetical protein